jgi:hypothetical protein
MVWRFARPAAAEFIETNRCVSGTAENTCQRLVSAHICISTAECKCPYFSLEGGTIFLSRM